MEDKVLFNHHNVQVLQWIVLCWGLSVSQKSTIHWGTYTLWWLISNLGLGSRNQMIRVLQCFGGYHMLPIDILESFWGWRSKKIKKYNTFYNSLGVGLYWNASIGVSFDKIIHYPQFYAFYENLLSTKPLVGIRYYFP